MKYLGTGDFSGAGLLITPAYASSASFPTAATGNRGAISYAINTGLLSWSNGSAWSTIGNISGTVAANKVVVGLGTSSVQTFSDFSYDNSVPVLTIGNVGTVEGRIRAGNGCILQSFDPTQVYRMMIGAGLYADGSVIKHSTASYGAAILISYGASQAFSFQTAGGAPGIGGTATMTENLKFSFQKMEYTGYNGGNSYLESSASANPLLINTISGNSVVIGPGGTNATSRQLHVFGLSNQLRLNSTQNTTYWSDIGTDTSGYLVFTNAFNRVGINANLAGAFNVVGGGNTSSTFSMMVTNSGATQSTAAFAILDNSTIGMGTNAPGSGAKLDISSTTQGFLPPRMTTTQKLAISSPANGLMLYDSDLAKMAVRAGGSWLIMGNIAGTLATTQVAFGSAAETINGSANFIWDNTNSRLGVNKATPTERVHVGGAIWAEGGMLRSSGTGSIISSSAAAGVRLSNTTGGTGISWGLQSSNNGRFEVYPDYSIPIFLLSSANFGGAVGSGGQSYLWGMWGVSGGAIGDSNCQTSTLTANNEITGTSATELWLDGAAVRAVLPIGTVWTGIIAVHARIKTQGNGSLVVGTYFSQHYKFSIHRVGSTTTLLGVEVIGTAWATGGYSPTISITADDTNEALKITYATGSGGGSTTVTRVSASIMFNDFQF